MSVTFNFVEEKDYTPINLELVCYGAECKLNLGVMLKDGTFKTFKTLLNQVRYTYKYIYIVEYKCILLLCLHREHNIG